MSGKVDEQTSMDETVIENEELEQLLEERQDLKQSVSDFRQKDKAAKTIIQGIETPTPFRVGRFVIKRSAVAEKSVSFETQASFRFDISLAGE